MFFSISKKKQRHDGLRNHTKSNEINDYSFSFENACDRGSKRKRKQFIGIKTSKFKKSIKKINLENALDSELNLFSMFKK
jgi:hypothetical protein